LPPSSTVLSSPAISLTFWWKSSIIISKSPSTKNRCWKSERKNFCS
jgi:hypothetical protein